MSDSELIEEILRQVLGAAQIIANRFAPITSADDFASSDAGAEKLDAICMQLIAIGESIKHIDKITEGMLLARYPQIEWKRIVMMQNVLTDHYFDLDVEVVYSVCANHIGTLGQIVEIMLTDLANH